MKSRLPFALSLIALAGGLTVAAQNVTAQQTPPGPPPMPGMERHGPPPPPPPHFVPSPADRAAFLDAHIAALHAGLKLTPEQEKLWPPVEAALRAGAKSAQERHEKFRSEPHPDDIIAFLRRISEAETARGETLKAIADAAAPLYATLTEEQKRRLPILMHKPHFFGGHFGMMGGMHDGPRGWRGGEDGPEGFGPHGPGPHDQGDDGPHDGWD
jgi:zinc resistance-associated protein